MASGFYSFFLLKIISVIVLSGIAGHPECERPSQCDWQCTRRDGLYWPRRVTFQYRSVRTNIARVIDQIML
jgi:hypothetical protein